MRKVKREIYKIKKKWILYIFGHTSSILEEMEMKYKTTKLGIIFAILLILPLPLQKKSNVLSFQHFFIVRGCIDKNEYWIMSRCCLILCWMINQILSKKGWLLDNQLKWHSKNEMKIIQQIKLWCNLLHHGLCKEGRGGLRTCSMHL